MDAVPQIKKEEIFGMVSAAMEQAAEDAKKDKEPRDEE
jgi:hypothetical protein